MGNAAQHGQPARNGERNIVTPRPTRRRFLKVGLLGLLLPLLSGCTEKVLGLFVGGLGQAGLAYLSPKKLTPFGGKITLPGTVADYPKGSITVIREGKFYLSHVPEGLLALYWKCTHLGCTVPWKPNEEFTANEGVFDGIFHCPCHSSIYARTGQNLAGPALRPLDIMAIELSGNQIIVDTGNITKRVRYEPEQATKI